MTVSVRLECDSAERHLKLAKLGGHAIKDYTGRAFSRVVKGKVANKCPYLLTIKSSVKLSDSARIEVALLGCDSDSNKQIVAQQRSGSIAYGALLATGAGDWSEHLSGKTTWLYIEGVKAKALRRDDGPTQSFTIPLTFLYSQEDLVLSSHARSMDLLELRVVVHSAGKQRLYRTYLFVHPNLHTLKGVQPRENSPSFGLPDHTYVDLTRVDKFDKVE